MNKRVEITNPIHPKFIIQHAVSAVVREQFNIPWTPRVVQQRGHKVEASNLKFIDYAVPCFELSNELSNSVEELTRTLVEALKYRSNIMPESEYFKYLNFEATGGYINIELNEEYIKQAIESTRKWFVEPKYLYDSNLAPLFALGYKEELGLIDAPFLALESLAELSLMLGEKLKITCILQEISEASLPLLSSRYMESNGNTSYSPQEHMQASRQIKKLFDRNKSSAEQIESKQKIDSLLDMHDTRVSALKGIGVGTVIPESEFYEKVHNFLDRKAYPTMLEAALIYDEANSAIYYASGEIITPLRSAEGFLYSTAYELFVMVTQIEPLLGKNESVVIMTTQQDQGLLKDFSKCVFGSNNHKIIFFDPQVAKADLNELQSFTIKEQFKLASEYLDANFTFINNKEIRQNILFLVDFPMDVTSYLLDLRFPIVFDLLNQAVAVAQIN